MERSEQVELDWAWKPFAATMLPNPDMLYWIPPLYRSPTSTLTRNSQTDPTSVSRSPSNATTVTAGSLHKHNNPAKYLTPERKFISSVYLFAQDNPRRSARVPNNQKHVSVAYLSSSTLIDNSSPLTLSKMSQALNARNITTNDFNYQTSSPVSLTSPNVAVLKVSSPVGNINDSSFSEISLQDLADSPPSPLPQTPTTTNGNELTASFKTVNTDKSANGSQIDDRSSFSTNMDERLLYSLAQANNRGRVKKRIIICLVVTSLAAITVIVILIVLLMSKDTSP